MSLHWRLRHLSYQSLIYNLELCTSLLSQSRYKSEFRGKKVNQCSSDNLWMIVSKSYIKYQRSFFWSLCGGPYCNMKLVSLKLVSLRRALLQHEAGLSKAGVSEAGLSKAGPTAWSCRTFNHRLQKKIFYPFKGEKQWSTINKLLPPPPFGTPRKYVLYHTYWLTPRL